MSPSDQDQDKIWQTRHEAQINIIDDLLDFMDASLPVEGQDRIRAALLALQEWSNDQFDFFVNGFKNRVLVPSRDYLAAYALRQTAEQTAYDISVLQRAYTQRLTKRGKQTLPFADKLAYMALKPAIDADLVHEATTVITYFQKEPNVRVTPYANLALIGIPYTCADLENILDENNDNNDNNGRDFLAIPHEIGHYVYSHGKIKLPNSTNSATLFALINDEVTPYPSWYTVWIEEIFADIYTTLVAGSAGVLSMLHLLVDNLNMIGDQGEHPVPIIRPETHFKVLDKMQNANPQLIANLKDHWYDTLLRRRGKQYDKIGKYFTISALAPEAQYAEKEMVRDYLYRTVEDILKVLDNYLPQLTANTWGKNSEIEAWDKVYENFVKNVLKDSLLDQVQLSIDPNQFKQTHHRDWFDKLKVISDKGNLTLKPNVWKSLLRNGWVTNGPEDVHGG